MESVEQDAQKLAEVLKERYGNTVPTSQAAALLLAQDAKIKSLERAVEREKCHAANLVEIGGREVRALQVLVRLLATEEALEALEKRLRFPLDLACDSGDEEGTLSTGLQMTAGQRSEKPPVNARLLAALEGMIAIANDSQGVAGYHQNGDVAEWAEFPEWTEVIDAIVEARQEARKA